MLGRVGVPNSSYRLYCATSGEQWDIVVSSHRVAGYKLHFNWLGITSLWVLSNHGYFHLLPTLNKYWWPYSNSSIYIYLFLSIHRSRKCWLIGIKFKGNVQQLVKFVNFIHLFHEIYQQTNIRKFHHNRWKYLGQNNAKKDIWFLVIGRFQNRCRDALLFFIW